MAKAFSSWTVLPHKPIEKLEDNLWRVEGEMNGGKVQRAMVVARLKDGGLVIHNAIALGDAEMKELEAFGQPKILVVPNGFHRQDARIWKERYKDLRVVCPAGARNKVEQVVPVDATLDDAGGDDTVTLTHVDGVKNGEGVMLVRSGDKSSLVFCDLLMNMARRTGLVGFFLAPTGRPSVPRVMRWMGVKDKPALVSHLGRLADTPGLRRVLVGHGSTITADPAAALKSAVKELG